MLLKVQVTLWSNFMFVRDQAPKDGDFTTIFGEKIDNNWFFHFFQYFTVNYHKRIFLHIFSILFGNILHTVMLSQYYTPSKEKRRFLYFTHLSKKFLDVMIPHLKALIQGVQNQQKNWAWHHPDGGHAHLTENALLLIELVFHDRDSSSFKTSC